MIIIGRLDGAIAGPDRYLEVKYEDLLSDPDTTFRRILRFLDIEFNDVVTFEESTEGVVAPANTHGNVGKYVLPYFDTTKASAWKDKLTADEIKTVERIGGDLLQELGYDLLQYSPDGPFEALSPWRVVSKRQGKLFRRLVNPTKTRKSRKDIIEVSPSPLPRRIVNFVRRSVNNCFSSRIVQQLRKNREMVN